MQIQLNKYSHVGIKQNKKELVNIYAYNQQHINKSWNTETKKLYIM